MDCRHHSHTVFHGSLHWSAQMYHRVRESVIFCQRCIAVALLKHILFQDSKSKLPHDPLKRSLHSMVLSLCVSTPPFMFNSNSLIILEWYTCRLSW